MSRLIVPILYRLGGPIGTYWASGQLSWVILGFFARAFSDLWHYKRFKHD